MSNDPGVSSEHGPRLAILISHNLVCPPFLPDLRAVRLIHINEAKFHRIFEFPKLAFELFFRDLILVSLAPAAPAFNNNATFVEVEIMFWTV